MMVKMSQLYKQLEDVKLAELSINNDEKALRELLLRIQKEISVFLHYFDPDFSSEHDLIQEILLKIIKNIRFLKSPKTIKKWVHKIIVNTYYDYIRKMNIIKKRINYELTLTEEKLLIHDNKHKRPHEETLNKELKDKIYTAIMKLPQNYRLIVLLRDFVGLSYSDIENILNLNIGTVKSRLARARNKLKQELRAYL